VAIAFAIRKNDPDYPDWLNDFLKDLKADSRYDKPHGTWFGSRDWFDPYRSRMMRCAVVRYKWLAGDTG